MKNILLLTDFSENAENAIHYAMHFYKNNPCTFYIMHVHKAGSFTADDLIMSPNASIYDAITKEPKKKLSALIDRLQKQYNNTHHTFKSIIDFDTFTDAVNQAVKQKDIDYILVGSNGATGANEVVFGSNTLNIIRQVNCPTIIIPEGFKYEATANLLLVLDPKDSLEDNPFNALKEFLNEHPQDLHILRINPHDEHSEDIQKDDILIKDLNCTYHIINNVPLHHALNSYIQTNAIYKVAIFSKKESFFERFFTGSTTTQVSKHIHAPLLIFHA